MSTSTESTSNYVLIDLSEAVQVEIKVHCLKLVLF